LLSEQFYKELMIPGSAAEINSELEKAGRVADYLEFANLMCHDALSREESCGAHFREEYQTTDGEALRDDEKFCYVSAWQWPGSNVEPILHKEPLLFEFIKLSVRNYS